MRRMRTLGLCFALGLPLLAGCHLFNKNSTHDPINVPVTKNGEKATTESLVNYLNQNAKRVQSMTASVDIQAKQGIQAVTLGGNIAAQRPRDFRLRAKFVGSPAVDIGSNDDRFWYWLSKANPPHYYFCTYKDLATGKVNVPFPVETDMVMAALNMSEYDPNGKYELKAQKDTLELIQDTVALSGQPVKRVTVFNKTVSRAPEPQVIEHILRDANGKMICRGTVQKVEVNRATGAVIPTRVSIEWPAQNVSMKLSLSDLEVNTVDRDRAAGMFQLTPQTGFDFYDLARNTVVRPSSFRRAAAEMPK